MQVKRHMTPAHRWVIIGLFVFILIPTIGSHMAFGGRIWLTRLFDYATSAMLLVVIWAFIDARKQAAMKRHRSRYVPNSSMTIGSSHNWSWQSDGF